MRKITIKKGKKMSGAILYSVDGGDFKEMSEHSKLVSFEDSLTLKAHGDSRKDIGDYKFSLSFDTLYEVQFGKLHKKDKEKELKIISKSDEPGNPNDNVTIEDDDI